MVVKGIKVSSIPCFAEILVLIMQDQEPAMVFSKNGSESGVRGFPFIIPAFSPHVIAT